LKRNKFHPPVETRGSLHHRYSVKGMARKTGASRFGQRITESNVIARVSALFKEPTCPIGMLPEKRHQLTNDDI